MTTLRSWRALIATLIALAMLPLAGLSATPAGANVPAGFDPATLDPVPVEMDGVQGLWSARSTPSLNIYVWAIQEAGDRMFVGGNFTQVRRQDGSVHNQSFLAAFDINTGEYMADCTVDLDGSVNAMAVNPRGRLLIGGEFTMVDGSPRQGLAAIRPDSCAVDTLFEGEVDRPWSSNRAVVREIEVIGDDLYVAGNFSHMDGPSNQRTRVYKVGRMHANWGTLDPSWKPEVTGSGVWGISADPASGRVHVAGFFSAVNGVAGTGNKATVDIVTGALSPNGLHTAPVNSAGRPEHYDVQVGVGNVWTAASEHVLHSYDPVTSASNEFYTTGMKCDGFIPCGYFGGGDFQFVDPVGDGYIIAGCHCTYSTRNGYTNLYSSATGQRTTHRNVMLFDAASSDLMPIEFDIHSNADGGWAAAGDRNGCVYVGGEFHVGGVDAGLSRDVYHVAKFCEVGWTPPQPPQPDQTSPTDPTGLSASSAPGSATVDLTWTASTDPVNPPEVTSGMQSYLIYRNGSYIGWSATPDYTDNHIVGAAASYQVRAVDQAGNRSSKSSAVTHTPGGTDNIPPSTPTGLDATDVGGGQVDLTWNASTDNIGVKSYLIYRNGSYIGWSPVPSYSDTSAPQGVQASYQVRATDLSDNRSSKSSAETIVPGGADNSPPTIPNGVAAVPAGADIDLTWNASTDNVAVQSYLIYRDGAYIGWSATTSFTDDNAPAGATVSYQLRATDPAGNRSPKSTPVIVTVP